MRERLKEIEREALSEIGSSRERDSLERIRVKYLGRKGLLTELFKKMGELPVGERPEVGKVINIVKENISKALDEKAGAMDLADTGDAERIDITLPGIPARAGTKHIITRTLEEICGIFISLGFRVVEGPEIETEYYNFEALNIPLEHPSRDAFDTFYLNHESFERAQDSSRTKSNGERRDSKYLLRSHTSPVQARFMEKNKPPFSIVVPGKVYRPDATDASHSFMFHQVEGLAVGKDMKFSDLKGVLALFAKQMFGEGAKMRFRPSFFPFTEPSAEVDVSCIICNVQRAAYSVQRGEGKSRCSVCGGRGWLEILGAGMVNPKVFKVVGYNPEKYTGFAFGMGVERIAMLKYGIDDIRLFFENDVRFLRQL
jgi:phenylalanyl-tRNA synthetase alpha chain